jgi:hypothetical protein
MSAADERGGGADSNRGESQAPIPGAGIRARSGNVSNGAPFASLFANGMPRGRKRMIQPVFSGKDVRKWACTLLELVFLPVGAINY